MTPIDIAAKALQHHTMTGSNLDHLTELQSEGFKLVDSFVLSPDEDDLIVDFEGRLLGTRTFKGAPSVYAWVACYDNRSEVIYVGLASQGWLVRRGQHFQGMRISEGAGSKNRLGIVAELQGHAAVKVLERQSGSLTCFGVKAPIHGVEEWALLARFRPRLNRATDIERAIQFAAS